MCLFKIEQCLFKYASKHINMHTASYMRKVMYKKVKVTNTIQNDQIMMICACYHYQAPVLLLAGQVYQDFLGGHVITFNLS